MFDLLFKNAQLVCEDYILSGDIAVKDGGISAILGSIIMIGGKR